MVKLASGITLFLVEEFGKGEFIRRISDPYWFQALSCVLGFDWHSSGTTTTTCGALKSAINSVSECGITVTGGKGRFSRRTLSEIEMAGDIRSLSTQKIEELKYASRMSAKIDNNCIQDEYQLYHHSFFFTDDGDNWAVVQQGLNSSNRYARRYHWSSGVITSFVDEPHAGICCDKVEKKVLDLTAKQSDETRQLSLDLIKDNPKHLHKYLRAPGQRMLTDFFDNVETYILPSRHPILPVDLNKKDWELLQKAYELQPSNYEELVAIRGIGAKKLRALALISDLIFGTKTSWKDPVKYSFAHGGKDGHPFPVDEEVYDHSIKILKDAVDNLANSKEKYFAIRRLESFLR
jgi:hypothetical protein